MLLNRTWQKRRVIVTRDIISFSFLEEDAQIDYIPLAEVFFVREMRDTADFNTVLSDHGHDEPSQVLHVLQIATEREGYNSGRAYYVRALSTQACEKLLHHLNKSAKAARRAAEAKNTFRRTQYRLRIVYHSGFFQATMALMICAVSEPGEPLLST